MAFRPGEIYYADFEQMEPHPVIIVSREEMNRGRDIVAIVCTSSKFRERANLPSCVPFRAGQFGFTKDCVARADDITLIDASFLDVNAGPIGVLDDDAMRSVIRAIGYVIGSDCEPEY
jgi:mRNA-degrading endonuclease toxin of MazEF toxin-antitoxin module